MAFNLASEFKSLLNLVLNPGENGNEGVGQIAKNIAMSATGISKNVEQLRSDWVNPNDPVLIAENELMNAAQSIELAAKRLAELRPRKELEAGKVMNNENMNFDDLIIESAKSIASATQALIQAATVAQKELVAEGKVQKKGKSDGQWSEGLVSAAKMVASATQSLVEAANALVTGEGEEENFIAAAKQVSVSTGKRQVFML